jgi:hypothetical protein
MSLKDSMTFHEDPREATHTEDTVSVEPLTQAPDAIVLVESQAAAELTTVTQPGVSDIREARADAFLAMVESGTPAKIAAKEVGTTLADIKRDPVVQAKFDEIISKYTFKATERRALVRARAAQIAIEGDHKDSLSALKLISEDPEVGLSSRTPGVAIQMNFDADTMNLLNKVPAIPGTEEVNHG